MKKLLVFVFLSCIQFAFCQKVKTSLVYKVKEPAKVSAKTPVLILLHGYGSNVDDLFDLGSTFDPSFLVFSLQAPNKGRDGGYAWFNIQYLPNNQKTMDYPQAVESRKKIMSFVSAACRAYGVDSTQVYFLGFSQGAIMCYELALSSPAKVAGIAALSGRLLPGSMEQKTNVAHLQKVKIFIAHGNSDSVLLPEESQKAYDFLKTKNITQLQFKRYEMPHSINGAEINDLKVFFSKALKR